MTSYLLDTNIISDLIRNPQGNVMQRIVKVGEEHVATSIIVAAELRFGAAKKDSTPLTERVEALLSRINVLPLERGADEIYAAIRVGLESKGTPIGANDLLIAAHAKFLDQSGDWILATANEREFQRIDGLSVENWL